MTDNPLKNFYRNKEVYVKLPSNYRYFTNKPKLSSDQELGVMPLSTKDEMLMLIPDTLYNGEALFEIFGSIVPDIEDPYEIVVPDTDIILLASRIAAYGKNMPVDVTCPHCKNHSSYEIDLTHVLAKLVPVPSEHIVEIDNLTVRFKPNSLKTVTANRMANLELNKLILDLSGTDDVSSQKEIFQKGLAKATAANIAIYADAIESVTTDEGIIVTDIVNIIDWLTKSSAKVMNIIKKNTDVMNSNGLPTSFNFVCSNEECSKDFDAPLEFNPAFFFKID
jgi:hypothetical protein